MALETCHTEMKTYIKFKLLVDSDNRSEIPSLILGRKANKSKSCLSAQMVTQSIADNVMLPDYKDPSSGSGFICKEVIILRGEDRNTACINLENTRKREDIE